MECVCLFHVDVMEQHQEEGVCSETLFNVLYRTQSRTSNRNKSRPLNRNARWNQPEEKAQPTEQKSKTCGSEGTNTQRRSTENNRRHKSSSHVQNLSARKREKKCKRSDEKTSLKRISEK